MGSKLDQEPSFGLFFHMFQKDPSSSTDLLTETGHENNTFVVVVNFFVSRW